jgi:predicted dehydrogenase/threonine dehydrogenase-like Zn-dependent dehydrogenase
MDLTASRPSAEVTVGGPCSERSRFLAESRPPEAVIVRRDERLRVSFAVKQVTQRLRDGRVQVVEVPPPSLTPDAVLVDVRTSLLSTGTERSRSEAARKTLLGKARARPDEVRRVLERARRDGVGETVRAVRGRLDAPSPVGYSAAGVALAVGERVRGVAPGDRVACGGGGHAYHAELDAVPGNLCVRLPDALSFEEGAFATVGCIALHAVRRGEPAIGERVAVIGLGLIGQLCGQILRAAGCTVVGVDLVPSLVDRALAHGAADAAFPRAALEARELPAGARDCDVAIVAAATASSDPVELAAQLCRDRARVVVVGDVGMTIPRRTYWEKELELRLARSYGPGRYDLEYEERGLDYPIGYVRWTERRNMAAFLELVAAAKVDVRAMVGERMPLERAPEAYERLLAAETSPLAIVLEYEPTPDPERPPAAAAPPASSEAGSGAVGVVGAGSFASRILIPGLASAGFRLEAVASEKGVSARAAADRFGFRRAATPEEVIRDASTGVVAIATRHDSHAALAVAALRAGKHVFVEKPPCLTEDELADLRQARDVSGRELAVGFNRRHAPLARELWEHVRDAGSPFALLYRVNAESLPEGHWLNDPERGGGRLLGEGCHFVDFACWLAGGPPERVTCTAAPEPGSPLAATGRFTVGLSFADGSVATILYAADGEPGLGKEYVEAHAGGRSAVLDDFRALELRGPGGTVRRRSRSADKGHRRQLAAFHRALTRAEPLAGPDPLDAMAATLAAARSLAVPDGS